MLARTLSPSHSYSFPPIQKRKGKRTSVPPVAAPHRSSSSIVMVIMRKKGFFCSTKQILPTNVLFYFFFVSHNFYFFPLVVPFRQPMFLQAPHTSRKLKYLFYLKFFVCWSLLLLNGMFNAQRSTVFFFLDDCDEKRTCERVWGAYATSDWHAFHVGGCAWRSADEAKARKQIVPFNILFALR